MSSIVELVAFDPTSEIEIQELVRQRKLCGWDIEKVPRWLETIKAGTKYLYWIYPTPDANWLELPESEQIPYTVDMSEKISDNWKGMKPLGHVGLDWIDPFNDPEIGNREEGKISLKSFFILRSQQGKRLGSLVLKELELVAKSPPINAKQMTLTTIASSQMKDPAWWDFLGIPMNPTDRDNEQWYAKKGYESFKYLKRVTWKGKDGTDGWIIDAVMRKDL